MGKIKLHSSKLIMLVISLAFLEPTFISHMSGFLWSGVHNAFMLLKILSILIGLLMLIQSKGKDKYILISIVLLAYLIINDVIHFSTGTIRTIYFSLSEIAIIGAIKYYQEKNTLDKFIMIFKSILALLILLNLIILIFKPNGIFRSELYNSLNIGADGHFFGYKNNHVYFFIPYTILSYIQLKDTYSNKIKFWFMHCIILSTLILIKASTALIIYILVTAGIIFFPITKKIKPIWIFNVSIIVSYLLIMTTYLSKSVAFIAAYFAKGVTLSGRQTVWNRGIQAFLLHPLLGTGIGTNPVNINYQQYHNKYLDFMVCGGVVLLILLAMYLLTACKRIDSFKNRMRTAGILCVLCYSLIFIMEGTRTELFFWVIMSICYYHKDDISDIGLVKKKYRLKEKNRKYV